MEKASPFPMTYRLKFNERLGKGWRRMVREQIEMVVDLLGSAENIDGAIHETRKSMKRVRALLKLLRPGLSASDYKRENRRYRDIGRVLSGVRDQAVLMATAQMLARQSAGEARAASDAFLSQLADAGADGLSEDDPVSLHDALREKAARVREALAGLEAASKSLDKLRFKEDAFSVVRRGIESSYRDARRDMKNAFESGADEDFHAWRMSVQAHWRHMLLIAGAWPDLFAARAQLAKEMSDLLGLDHDLFVLIARARSLAGPGDGEGGNAMVRAARQRQSDIRKELKLKGAALLAEPTSRFVARVAAYWHAAKGARKFEKRQKRARDKAAPSLSAPGAKEPRVPAAGGGRDPIAVMPANKAATKVPAATRHMQARRRVATKRKTPPGKN